MTRPDYHLNYLRELCEQNRRLFDSPYLWQFGADEAPLNARQRLSQFRRTSLEIGFGHGEVLEALVQKYPDTGFVGIERRPARVKKALKRLHRIKANNALLIRINLELIEKPLFAEGSFDEVLINHPDPWPKRRHEQHRFFKPATMDWLASLLGPTGSVEVASDDAAYFFGILRMFEEDARLVSVLPAPFYTKEPIEERVMSRFERRVRGTGGPVWILRFLKR